VDSSRPLGSYPEFAAWTGQPRVWGEGAQGEVSFAGDVIDALAAGLAGHPEAVSKRLPAKAEAIPVALGCVPWLSSSAIVDALLAVGHQLVIIDKGSHQRSATDRLNEAGAGIIQSWLPGLDEYGPLDVTGEKPVIGPGTMSMPGNRPLGPVRVVGWRKEKGRGIGRLPPLLHAKVCVLGAAYTWEGEYGGFDDLFLPMRVWLGSANWTEPSTSHIEFGLWSDDEKLAEAALQFFCDLVRFSEPYDTATAGPSPELVAADWDDEAFGEYVAEHPDAYDPEGLQLP